MSVKDRKPGASAASLGGVQRSPKAPDSVG
jgi:hypothetical protein